MTRLSLCLPGFCPMGCGETLLVDIDTGGVTVADAEDGMPVTRVRCLAPRCPEPFAVGELLADGETEHVAFVTIDGFTVRHPLRERVGAALQECEIHGYLAASLDDGWMEPGTYRVRLSEDELDLSIERVTT